MGSLCQVKYYMASSGELKSRPLALTKQPFCKIYGTCGVVPECKGISKGIPQVLNKFPNWTIVN